MNLGTQLRNYRKQVAKMTQPEVAKLTKLSKSLIINYENEYTEVLKNINNIVDALGARIIIIGKDDDFYVKSKEV